MFLRFKLIAYVQVSIVKVMFNFLINPLPIILLSRVQILNSLCVYLDEETYKSDALCSKACFTDSVGSLYWVFYTVSSV